MTDPNWVTNLLDGLEEMAPDNDTPSFYDSKEIRKLGIACGDGCLLHKNALVYNPENVRLGVNVRIDAFSILSPGKAGYIHIGNFTHVSSHCLFIGSYGIEIGSHSAVAAGSKLFSVSDDMHGHGLIGPMVPIEHRALKVGEITLHDDTCLAVNAVVMPGSTLSRGSVLLANSLLKGPTEEFSLYMGVPAVRVKERRRDFLKYLES
jgi:galactoside O-acetyltransferase